jgi:hypothetical protein
MKRSRGPACRHTSRRSSRPEAACDQRIYRRIVRVVIDTVGQAAELVPVDVERVRGRVPALSGRPPTRASAAACGSSRARCATTRDQAAIMRKQRWSSAPGAICAQGGRVVAPVGASLPLMGYARDQAERGGAHEVSGGRSVTPLPQLPRPLGGPGHGLPAATMTRRSKRYNPLAPRAARRQPIALRRSSGTDSGVTGVSGACGSGRQQLALGLKPVRDVVAVPRARYSSYDE